LGYTVLYRSILDLVGDLAADPALTGQDKLLERYLKPELLIIDDMGLKRIPPQSGEHLFEIIMRRHEARSTIMTSNRPIEEWGKLPGDVPAAGAILDRFLQHAQVIAMAGRGFRLKDNVQTPVCHKQPTPSRAGKQENSGREQDTQLAGFDSTASGWFSTDRWHHVEREAAGKARFRSANDLAVIPHEKQELNCPDGLRRSRADMRSLARPGHRAERSVIPPTLVSR
jgi:hypothetical protein